MNNGGQSSVELKCFIRRCQEVHLINMTNNNDCIDGKLEILLLNHCTDGYIFRLVIADGKHMGAYIVGSSYDCNKVPLYVMLDDDNSEDNYLMFFKNDEIK